MDLNTVTLLSQLKSASLNKKENITIKVNHFTISVLEALYLEGFILSYTIVKKENFINNTVNAIINLRYIYNKPIFENLKILSSPSFSRIVNINNIYRLNPKKNTFFFSTDKGLLTLSQCKQKKIGGILLFIC